MSNNNNKMKDDTLIVLKCEIDLKEVDDSTLVHIRNRVMWECKRRIEESRKNVWMGDENE